MEANSDHYQKGLESVEVGEHQEALACMQEHLRIFTQLEAEIVSQQSETPSMLPASAPTSLPLRMQGCGQCQPRKNLYTPIELLERAEQIPEGKESIWT